MTYISKCEHGVPMALCQTCFPGTVDVTFTKKDKTFEHGDFVLIEEREPRTWSYRQGHMVVDLSESKTPVNVPGFTFVGRWYPNEHLTKIESSIEDKEGMR